MSSPITTNPRNRLVFDIDNVLAIQADETTDGDFLNRYGFTIPEKILEDGNLFPKHYVFPGVIGLMRAICLKDDFDLCFFSAGKKWRNVHLIQELFKQCFPEEHQKYLDKIDIYSREDLVNGQKDLKTVLKEGHTIENTLIVDDTLGVIKEEDDLNHILPKRPSYHKLKEQNGVYNDNGLKQIQCYIAKDDPLKVLNKEIYKQIVVFPREGELFVLFQNIVGWIHTEKLPETLPLDELKAISFAENKTHQLLPEEISGKIKNLMKSAFGKTEKVCRAANQIYWIAGFVFTLVQGARETETSLRDFSSDLYKSMSPNPANYNLQFSKKLSRKMDPSIFTGLKIIRSHDPSAELITEKHFRPLPKTSDN